MANYAMTRAQSDYSRHYDRANQYRHDYVTGGYARYQISRLPIVGDFYRASDQEKYYNDYLRNTRQTWDDVKYPALLGGQNWTGAIAGAVSAVPQMMISRNLLRMYR